MKFFRLFFVFTILFTLFSCGSDDDICLGGEATPRMKLKFKTQLTGKLKTLDSLYIKVDYGNGPVSVIAVARVDSVLIPLRVEDVPFTKIYVSLLKNKSTSEIKINYTTKTQYVSPACGIKKIYENAEPVLEVPNPVLSIEKNQNQIIDESKTHFYLLF